MSNTEWRTFWWRGNIPNFPHVYEMDFSKIREINELRIGCSANQGLYPVDSEVEVRLAPYNYSIKAGNETIDYSPANYSLDHNQSIVFFGNLTKNKQYIAFDKIEKGRYLRVTFLNNRAIWKDNHKGRSAISSIDIGSIVFNKKFRPITMEQLLKINKGFDYVYDGYYWNGKGGKETKETK